jgi:mannitol/fructose-specific phosphotransferase system IIA component (Ntr-type)
LGIALPHARSEYVDSFVIAIGRVKDGVNFGSLDGEPVRLVFLMGTPKEKVQSYLKLLAHLTRLLKRESVRSLLFEAETPEEIIEIFKKEESFSNA